LTGSPDGELRATGGIDNEKRKGAIGAFSRMVGAEKRRAWEDHIGVCAPEVSAYMPEVPDWFLSPAERARDWLGLGPRPVRELEVCGQEASFTGQGLLDVADARELMCCGKI
jgi:hypothetical protein